MGPNPKPSREKVPGGNKHGNKEKGKKSGYKEKEVTAAVAQ